MPPPQAAKALGIQRLKVLGDSDVVVRQAMGKCRIKDAIQRTLMERVGKVKYSFQEFSIDHVPRKQNATADKLSQEAIEHPALQGLEQRVCIALPACQEVVALIGEAKSSGEGSG